jgi:hypothetical protein
MILSLAAILFAALAVNHHRAADVNMAFILPFFYLLLYTIF